MRRTAIKDIHASGGVLEAVEVFDYGCPVQSVPTPDGNMGLAKMHFSSRMDSTLSPCTAYISLAGALLYYLDDLDERGGDASHYKEFIQTAATGSNEAAKRRMTARSGIVLATGMPGGGPLGRR